jgi:methyl-accepting chemotaxis protein
MQEGVDAVQDVVDAFGRVTVNVEKTDSGIQDIRDTTDDQASSAEEVVSMVEDVTAISATTTDLTEDAATDAREQAASMAQISENVGSLDERADRLQALLATFDVDGSVSESDVAVGDGGRVE